MSALHIEKQPRAAVSVDSAVIDGLIQQAEQSLRKRAIYLLHHSHEASLHTMVNALCHGTYATPHHHHIPADPEDIKKGESFLALRGTGAVLIFDDAGAIIEAHRLNAQQQSMVWIPAGVWHSVVVTSEHFVVFENKTGPWEEGKDKVFHPAFPLESIIAGEADTPANAERRQELLHEWENRITMNTEQ